MLKFLNKKVPLWCLLLTLVIFYNVGFFYARAVSKEEIRVYRETAEEAERTLRQLQKSLSAPQESPAPQAEPKSKQPSGNAL